MLSAGSHMAPFRLQFYMNGNNLLVHKLQKKNISYRMHDNAFLEISDVDTAQKLSDRINPEGLHKVLDVFAKCYRALSNQSVRRMINKYTSLAAIELHITPHMFRHTFATSLLEADVDIRYIQEMLGRSSINITEIYTHVAMSKQMDILATKHPRKEFNIQSFHIRSKTGYENPCGHHIRHLKQNCCSAFHHLTMNIATFSNLIYMVI